MKLVDVQAYNLDHVGFLYRVLAERTPEQSISHKRMPSFNEHKCFVESAPYAHWWLLEVDGNWVGAMYVTVRHEVGLTILRDQQKRGYGREALATLFERGLHVVLYANVNPNNARSRVFFERNGGELIQVTYELPVHRS